MSNCAGSLNAVLPIRLNLCFCQFSNLVRKPKENLQDGLYAQFGAFSKIRLGDTLDTVTRLDNNAFAQTEPGSGRYIWSWKSRIQLGYEQIEDLLTRTIAEERKRQNPGSLDELVKSLWFNDNSVSDIEIQQEVRKELGTIRARFGQKPAGIREAMHYEMLEKMHAFIANLSHPMERTVGAVPKGFRTTTHKICDDRASSWQLESNKRLFA